jgi:hypothetical protein
MSRHTPLDPTVRPGKSNRRRAGRSRLEARRYRPRLEPLEQREVPVVSVYQQGAAVLVNGAATGAAYTGTQDSMVSITDADTAGDFTSVQVAGSANASFGTTQGLIRFDNLFGTGANQIPVGARINSAALTLEVPDFATNATSNVLLHQMLANWDETSTWNSLTGGVQINGTDAVAAPDDGLTPGVGLGPRFFNITRSVQAWSYTAQPNTSNRGWVLSIPAGNQFWQFQSSESPGLIGGRAPILAIDWTAPTNGTLGFSAATYSLLERGGSATITVNRTDGGLGAVAINYAVTAGTAAAPADFTLASGTLNFAANEFSKTFTVAIANDTLREADEETVNLTLSGPTGGAVLGAQATAVLTIIDDENPGTLQFNQAAYTIAESGGTATITVTRAGLGAGAGAVSVQYEAARASATPGQDFGPAGNANAITGTLSWAANDTNPKTFTIPILNDTTIEPSERVRLTLRNATGGATLGAPSSAFLTITDNDGIFPFQQGAAGYAGTLDTEIRSGQPAATQGGNATVSVDADNAGGVSYGLLRFNNLFGTGAGQIPPGATIVAATLTVFATDTSGAGAVIGLHRMLVNWDANSTWNSATFGGNGPQTNGTEAAVNPDATIPEPNVSNVTKTLNVLNTVRAWQAGAPTYGWVLINNSTDGWDFASSENGTAANRPRLSVTIEAPPHPGYLSFSAADYTVDEGGGSLTVTVNREFGTVGAVAVNYAASNGTATVGQDYTAASGTLSFAAGEASKTFTIPILEDTLLDPDETILLALSGPTGGAVLGDFGDAMVTVVDNDGPGTLQFGAPTFTVNENGVEATLTVTRTRGRDGSVSVDYAAGTGTATFRQDFLGATGTITFGAGELSQTIIIPLLDDALDELSETISFTLSNPTRGAVLGSQTSAVLTIVDNERSLVIQQGLNGYAGTQDTHLLATTPDTASGGGTTFSTDLADGTPSLQVQGLLRFDNLFGTGPNQIPTNALIHSATLTVQVTSESEGFISINRMLVNWTETSTWNALGNGIQPVTEAALFPDSQPISLPLITGPRGFDVTSALQTWLRATNPNTSNLGWVFFNDTTNGWTVVSSEGANGLQRPRLEVVYSLPAATAPLRVTSLTGGANGFTLGFNQAFDPTEISVFGSPSAPPDVTLVGPGGPVAGTLVVNPLSTGVNAPFGSLATFIPTGGPLAAGTYTVTLRSAADGLQNLYGDLLLDGNGDGTAGDNYTNTFTVAAPAANARTVSLPNFVRGPNQAVALPTGIPIRLSDGQGVTAASLQIRYDPALLTISGVTVGTGLTGATATLNTNTPGLAQVTFTSPTALAAGAVDFVRLTATVRVDAPYSAKHVLDLASVTVTAGTTALPVVEDDGLHIVGYLGDLNGNGAYESADASLVRRFIEGTEAGFGAYQLAAPGLVADVNQDGQITTADAEAVAQLAAGTTVPGVPARPANPASPIPGGADPRLYLPTDLTAGVGQTVTVPVLMEVTDPAGASLSAVDVTLRYDPTRFAVGNLQLGELLVGFRGSFNAQIPGELRLVAFTGHGPELALGASGALFLVDFTVLPGAALGASTLNLLASLGGTTTALYGNDLRPLTLVPAPTDAAGDAADGRFTVVALPEPVPVARPVAGGVIPAQDGQDSGLVALSLLLGETSTGTGGALGGDLGMAPAAAAREAIFASYGSEGSGDALATALPFGSGVVEGRTGAAAPVGSEGSDLFDVDALFASLGERS